LAFLAGARDFKFERFAFLARAIGVLQTSKSFLVIGET
jgi:hypothetical protein